MADHYTILSFPSDFFQIFHFPKYEHSLLPEDVQNKDHVKYLLRYLKDINCKSILVEHEYVDHDYLDDYASFYAKCFTPYRRFCRRAHFWKTDIKQFDIEKAIIYQNEEILKILGDDYLGFLVIKPLPEALIGRTVLSRYDDEGGKRKIKTIRPYKVNLFGLQLEIESLAFQEQDTVMAACATTAIWSAFHKASHIFHTSIPTPSDITKSATKYIQTTRPIPTHGLNVEQMCYAISENGLTPEVQPINIDTSINSLIYSYVSADIPVVLGYRIYGKPLRHAVTVCGYRLEERPSNNSETNDPDLDINLIGRRISELYVHDDNLGPFSRLRCIDAGSIGQSSKINPRIFVRETDDDRNEGLTCIPEVVLTPIYHKIRLRFNDILGAIRLFAKYFDAVGINKIDEDHPDGIEWEIRLCDVKKYRKKIIDSNSIEKDIKKSILFRNMPKFLWIGSAMLGKKRLFSFIADATNVERSFYFIDFVCHYKGLKSLIASMIKTGDPNLSKAKEAGLPSAFLSFIERYILN
jgi:hypothetical protein